MVNLKKYCEVKNDLAFYLGPVLPSRTDGSSFRRSEVQNLKIRNQDERMSIAAFVIFFIFQELHFAFT